MLSQFRSSLRSDRVLLLGLTLVVAFCSIVYELIYSEMLRVLFGGTVLRYSITIGLYLFSLGIGAFLYNYVGEAETNFFRIEVLLAVVGPLGLLVMILLNSVPDVRFPAKDTAVLVASHLPIIAVGVLSGLEIPFLSSMVTSERSAFSEVLGVDYFGSLVGTVVYALFLYPSMGLITAIVVLGLLNAVAALSFAVRFTESSKALLLVGLLLTGTYAGVLANEQQVEDSLTDFYVEGAIESEYPPGTASVDVTERHTTKYQDAVLYERQLTDLPGSDTCLRLDMAVQLCDRWVDSYHEGLVDVPMSQFENGSETRVLLIGGGDWIAVDHLREYGVTVDHVDIDGEFMNYTRDHAFFEQYHNDAYEYDRLTTHVADARTYLRSTDRQYDLILLDLPGARSDDALPLYSTEFYTQLRQHVTDDGMVATWVYSRHKFTNHHMAYVNTVREAGFRGYADYNTYDDLDRDGQLERGEQFYLLSPSPSEKLTLETARNARTDRVQSAYERREWRAIDRYRGVEPNSIFDPNYDIVIGYV
ncbi:Spermidine synthase [Halomicrobium sp. LC1Hm]|nr:Spermidine synthase [Halomicrobium sp. LC1Hm]